MGRQGHIRHFFLSSRTESLQITIKYRQKGEVELLQQTVLILRWGKEKAYLLFFILNLSVYSLQLGGGMSFSFSEQRSETTTLSSPWPHPAGTHPSAFLPPVGDAISPHRFGLAGPGKFCFFLSGNSSGTQGKVINLFSRTGRSPCPPQAHSRTHPLS